MERHGQLPDVVDRLVLPLHQALLLRTFVRRLKGLEEEAADDGVGDDEAGQPDVGEEEGRGRLAVAHEALAGPSPSLPPRFLFHVPRHRLRTDDGCGSAFGCPVHCALHAGVSLLLVAEVWILHGACTRVCCVYTCTTCVSGCRFSLVGVGIDNLMLTRLRFYVCPTRVRAAWWVITLTRLFSRLYTYIYTYTYTVTCQRPGSYYRSYIRGCIVSTLTALSSLKSSHSLLLVSVAIIFKSQPAKCSVYSVDESAFFSRDDVCVSDIAHWP